MCFFSWWEWGGVSLFVQVYTPLTYQVKLNEMKINFLGTLIRLIDNNH